MEVILVIQGTWVITEIVEIVIRDGAEVRVMFVKMIRDDTIETSPGPHDIKIVMIGVRRPSCQWAEGTIHRCCPRSGQWHRRRQ